MKIALDIRSLGYTSSYTGVEEYVYQIAYLLPRLDPETKFILFYNTPSDQERLKLLGEPQNATLVNLKRNNLLLNLRLKLFNSPKLESLLKGKPDLVWVPSYRPLTWDENIKRVTVFHDLSFALFPHFFSHKARLWHKLINPRKQAEQSNHLIAVSRATKNDLVKNYSIPATKISVIHNGVQLPPISNNDLVKYNSRLGLPRRFIFTLSSLNPRKNFFTLYRAFKLLKQEIKLPHKIVIGGKREWLKRSDRKMLQDPDVVWLNYLSPKAKVALYKLADIFVLPSYYEGFGIPVLEAMQLNVPIITSGVSALPEVAQDCALLVNPNNTSELKNALKSLLVSQKLRSALTRKALLKSKQFNWKACAEQTLKVLKQTAQY
jgi:glycosyltransferase involved in cell wall biosynthesis